MELSTLQGLEAAYKAAASAELAKVICLAYVEHNEKDKVEEYFSACWSSLNDHEQATIATYLLEQRAYRVLLEHLDPENAQHGIWLSHCYLMNDQLEEAQRCYRHSIELNPSLKELALEQKLQLNEQSQDRPKLRVVEKNNLSEITSLSRYREETTTFSDVVGLEKIKKQIHKKIIMPFQRPSLFQRFKKKVGGGVILYGPPGCGKTLLARATAGECHANFYNIEISDVLDMYIGESEQKLHAIFEKARASTPSVLFFDEIEALAGKREHSRNSNTANIVSQFLTELDGFSQANEGVLVLASTNVPWSVDAAFLRPGRFDRMFFVPPPDRQARESILAHHMKERPVEGEIDYSAIAKKTSGYSGADLSNLVEMAADEAIDESIELGRESSIKAEHFKLALAESRATTLEWLTTARNYARYANDGGRYDDVLAFLKKHGK